jgi:hypothetical protein
MSTIINATTTNGVVIQPDNSGSLVLQTNSGTTALTIDTSQRAAFVAGTAAAPAITTTGDTNTGMFFPAADTIAFAEGGTERMRIDSNGNVGIGTTSPTVPLNVISSPTLAAGAPSIVFEGSNNTERLAIRSTVASVFIAQFANGTLASPTAVTSGNFIGAYQFGGYAATGWDRGAQVQGIAADTWTDTSTPANIAFYTVPTGTKTLTERMRIDSSGNVLVGKTSVGVNTAGIQLEADGGLAITRVSNPVLYVNRNSTDGTLVEFRQDNTAEGTISVSGSTVSYNGGHLSRWSQWQNETGKPEVYRGTILESVNAMCVWEKDGEPLPNEQATKTIVSTTSSSKAVAGVFDRYDEDDQDNPYDFYVAQSGDFVIRIAEGVTVQNGDLLESAGDGTAKPQADDICRSSTIAKVTSNYISATYEDGSYCVPCILMIG